MVDSHPILDCKHAAAFESDFLKSDNERTWTVMQRVGTALGEAILRDYLELGPLPRELRVLVLAGKGHNGGDALLGAGVIKDTVPDAAVDVVIFGKDLRENTAKALDNLEKRDGVKVLDGVDFEKRYDLLIDGVLGMGFEGELRSNLAEVFEKINGMKIGLRAAVDMPSGWGLRADFTYGTGILKAELLQDAKRGITGRLRYLDVGFFEGDGAEIESECRVLKSSILEGLQGLRAVDTYKNKQGHLLIVAGSKSFPGAMLMSVKGALHAGLGLVSVCAPESLVAQCTHEIPEAMWIPGAENADGNLTEDALGGILAGLDRADAILMGPGLGDDPETEALVCAVIKNAECPILLDASALKKDIMEAVKSRPEGWGRVLVTPHVGELERMGSSPEAFKTWTTDYGVIGLLKGPVSRITGGGACYISTYGGPVLARGGSGDILSGIVGGCLAGDIENPMRAMCRGVVWHGMSAELLARRVGQTATTTTELLKYLSEVIRSL